jgi:hypothetical protein
MIKLMGMGILKLKMIKYIEIKRLKSIVKLTLILYSLLNKVKVLKDIFLLLSKIIKILTQLIIKILSVKQMKK